MTAPAVVLDLVARFREQRQSYLSPAYNETQLRREFLDPLFEALGWDMHNRQGHAESYKEVIHEDALRVEESARAPDYAFRVGGTRAFLVEAKKPAVNLREDPSPAFQLRRYAWSAGLPLSILTDFQEFIVYDCRVKPDQRDRASTARVLYLTSDDYETRWDEIAGIFSKEAVLKGAFDRYAATGRKRGTQGVDAAFLGEIEGWRDSLARNLALRNPDLTVDELNMAVGRIIDRIIFLRIAEDRGIEEYGRLQALQNGPGIYGRLRELFARADERYNSGLFHFRIEKGRAEHPDTLSLRLAVDDKPLKEIIRHLYYPDSPYEFSALPADILGQVYEQFLGKVIRLTAGHQAKVEEKPEVKKAGGVFYTPTWVVEYIVGNTVGRLLEGKTPKGAAKLRILDPACGSGSFLIGAYQRLLDWHRNWYAAHDPEKLAVGKAPVIHRAANGEWRLTTAERKRILTNSIFGVDIDRQAVEVTKLSLLLKVLEGESGETISRQLRFFHERALPDLADNVKCGNSLIGPDFFDGRLEATDEERTRVNPFDWQAEFPGVMAAGGFDAVIGNPPYIRIQTLKEWAPLEVEFYKERYRAAGKGNYDIYTVFVERGLELLKRTGRLGFILPHKFFNAQYGEPLRSLIAAGRHLAEVVHFGDQQVFKGATTYTCLMFLDKAGCDEFAFTRVADLNSWRGESGSPGRGPDASHPREVLAPTGCAPRGGPPSASPRESPGQEGMSGTIPAAKAGAAEWNFAIGRSAELLERLQAMPVKLGDIADIFVGLQTSADTVFLFKEHRASRPGITEIRSKELEEWRMIESALLKKVVRGGDIEHYSATPSAKVLFPYQVQGSSARLYSAAEMSCQYPLAWEYLNQNKKLLQGRESGKFDGPAWFQLYPKNLSLWEQAKVLIPYMTTRLRAYPDHADHLYFVNVTTGGFGVVPTESACGINYLCGLLNSRLLDFFLKQVSTTFHGGYFAANKQFIEQLPIRQIDFGDPEDRRRHDEMVALVERMLDLHRRLPQAHEHDRTLIERQIRDTDRRIDLLVYDLYDLTPADISLLEGQPS